jgi:hypothetical protein
MLSAVRPDCNDCFVGTDVENVPYGPMCDNEGL